MRRPELSQRELLKQSASGNNGALPFFTLKNKSWWGSGDGRRALVASLLCVHVCVEWQGLFVSSKGLNGGNCQLAL